MTKNIIILALILFTGVTASAQDKKVVTTTFEVSGICGMCEDRIETAMDVKGVKTAEYDLDSHLLTVTYATKKISEDELHALLNQAGHDTEKSKATNAQYDSVHDCCKYREHDDH